MHENCYVPCEIIEIYTITINHCYVKVEWIGDYTTSSQSVRVIWSR